MNKKRVKEEVFETPYWKCVYIGFVVFIVILIQLPLVPFYALGKAWLKWYAKEKQ